MSWLVRITGTMIVVAGLHAGREFLVPCSISILLALLLAPLSKALEGRIGRRAPAAIATVLAASLLIGWFGWMLTREVAGVAGRLPQYRENIHAKALAMGPLGGLLDRGFDFLEGASAALTRTPQKPLAAEPVADGALGFLGDVVLSAFNTLGSGLIVLLLVVFLLVYRHDLRDRLVQLLGAGRVGVSTRAMEDAAGSVGRYLLLQTFVNLAYGVVVTGILLGLGIPNAVLWGILAALSRFIPYFGPWLGASLPLFLSLAVFPGWTTFALLGASWLTLELILANGIEPVLYGRKCGLSPLAVLLAAVFWTWIWGGPGLLMSIPLTVSLVVLGKHFAPLRFLHTLLADDASLEPRLQLYQRLLARDLQSAEVLGERFGEGQTLGQLYDRLFIPTLSLVCENRQSGLLEEEEAARIVKSLSSLVDDASERLGGAGAASLVPHSSPGPRIVCIATSDAADELGARMLGAVLEPRQVMLEKVAATQTVGEKVRQAADLIPDVVLVVSIHPSPLIPVRYLCKKLQATLPKVDLLVALLHAPGDADEWSPRILAPDGPRVATSLQGVEERLEQVLPPLIVRKAAALSTVPGAVHL